MTELYPVRFELSGWELFFADLSLEAGAVGSAAAASESLCLELAERLRDELDRETLASHPPVAALRKLFKEAGCDPSRYRPASEALLRRLLKGDPFPRIHPIVDVNNALSATLAVPCCVMAAGSFTPPFVFRAGRADESYQSLRGPFRLEGKPLLLDGQGPCDAPITGSERVKVGESTTAATLVAYLPSGTLSAEQAEEALDSIRQRVPGLAVNQLGVSR